METHLLIIASCFIALSWIEADAKPKVTAMFVFGDSLNDPGNNIYFIISEAKANYWPYGIDFDQGLYSAGRFSNGKAFVDFIGELLGLPLIPSYADTIAKNADIISGVNFASAGAGILEDSGNNFGRVIPLREQIVDFKNTLNQLREQLQTEEELSNYLSKAFVFMDVGTNDYLNNYILPLFSKSSRIYSPQQFADLLIKLYTGYMLTRPTCDLIVVKELQSLGLRKFAIAEVAPVGCIPVVLVSRGLISTPGECDSETNNLVQMFNSRLKPLVSRLNADNPGSIFTLGASFQMLFDLRDNADAYGLKVKDKACCQLFGTDLDKPLCVPFAEPCDNRNEYLFWDGAHPTQAANRILAHQVFSNTSYSFPLTIQKIAQM